MKNFTQSFFCCLCVLLASQNIKAQVTKLSNNTNLVSSLTLGNKAFLKTQDDSIWITNGTAAGTKKLVSTVSLSNDQAVVFQNKVFFAGKNAANGIELWTSDGTAANTKLFKDINAGVASSSPTNLFVYNNTLFFFATTAANGTELWKSDGTKAGTVMVKDINPGAPSSFDSNATIFFFPVNNVLLFQANDGTHGSELWKTDGSAGNTTLVKDLNPGKNSLQITTFNSLNNKMIFSGKDSATFGIKIWQTDGTAGGTSVIKTILPTSSNTNINVLDLSKFKSQLIFMLSGYTFNFPLFTQINQLYTTNGTSAGTKLLKDFQSVSLTGAFGTLTPTINNKFYFTTYSSQGSALWGSDGTVAGTQLTKTIIATSFDQNSGRIPIILTDFLGTSRDSINLKNFNGKFFMIADDSVHGYEPWITDGTATGTKLVKDIFKNKGSSIALDSFTFIYSQQGLYFTANDNTTGNELWLSNGTVAGTAEVADINPGKKSSNPKFVGLFNSHLLINANDGDNTQGKTDLYQVNATFDTLPKPQNAVAATIAPDGSTFSVYPNPAKEQLNISLNKSFSSQHVSFMITDQKGQQLYSNEVNGMQGSLSYTINISRLAQGTYYLEMITDKGVVTTKFIKTK
jgi:ELWxxDGT repeat protein